MNDVTLAANSASEVVLTAPEGASGLGATPAVPLSKTASRARVKQLDVLRAVAVLLVLCAHVESFEWLKRCGWIGVDLFFVLSGFLVSGLLYNEYKKHRSIKPKLFLLRRGLKIYPAFYFFVLGSVIITLVSGGALPLRGLLAEALFVQNYFLGLWGHTWSLCVEEHFYLLLTATVYFLWRRGGAGASPFDSIPKLTLAVAVLVFVARILTHLYVKPFDFQTHFKPTHLRIDALLFGVCLAYFHHFHQEKFIAWVKKFRAPILILSLLAISPSVVYPADSTFMSTIGFTLLYLGFGGLLLVFLYFGSSLPEAAKRILRPPANLLAWVGAYSYSIYLWHLVVATLGLTVFRRVYARADQLLPMLSDHPNSFLEFTVYVISSLAVGILMGKVIEMPVLKLRDHYFPARS